jgi:hypothetical protein
METQKYQAVSVADLVTLLITIIVFILNAKQLKIML